MCLECRVLVLDEGLTQEHGPFMNQSGADKPLNIADGAVVSPTVSLGRLYRGHSDRLGPVSFA